MNIADSIKMSLLVILLGPLGHLLGRAIYLNGSLDKIWLSAVPVFWLPPFSISTAVAMSTGFVEPGQGESPLDGTLSFTFWGTLFLPFMFNATYDYFLNNNTMEGPKYHSAIQALITTLIVYMLISIPMYIRESNMCNTKTSVSRVIFNASLAHLVGTFVKVAMSYLISYTPIGTGMSVVADMLPFSDKIKEFGDGALYAMGTATAVLFTNMYQNSYLGQYCDSSFSALWAVLFLCGGVGINIAYDMFREV